MDFTKEEISLCKQVAKKHRKEIKVGDYILWEGEYCLVIETGKIHIAVKWKTGQQQVRVQYRWIESKYIIPLWTISDCLEFLREKIGIWYELRGYRQGPPYPKLKNFSFTAYKLVTKGKTPLEVCLKAVLAVLEDSNG